MRTLLALTLFATACTTAAPAGEPTYDSVRDRLSDTSDGPTRLFVGGVTSSGTVTARRWTAAGWIEGDEQLVIENGEIAAMVDADGKLALKSFSVGIAPIAIPDEVFKKPAQLTDVRVNLMNPASGAADWADDDSATARLTLDLDLDWSITVNGGKTPLGAQHLPPVDVDFALSGDGQMIEASIGLAATGELWNWAGLLELTRLELTLSAATVD